jgi:hypothetical protein
MTTILRKSMSDLSLNELIAKENDWTFEHIRTLITWLNYSNVNMFLIDLSIKYYKSIISHIMAYTLLFSTVSSTISISQLGISQETQPQLFAIVQYCFIGASTLSTLLIGYMKLFKVQESLDTNTLLYKSWLTFSTRISSEFQMPVHMRTSALELLQNMKNEYIELFCKDANIPFPVKNSANNYFRRNLNRRNLTILSARNDNSCCSSCFAYRVNYIKRTNVFFIFQDIIKNEIKRLSAELTPINYATDNQFDNLVPSYYGNINEDTYKRNKLNPQVTIEYIYDGPFIIIDVKDRSESMSYTGKKQHNRDTDLAEEAAKIARSTLDTYKANVQQLINDPSNFRQANPRGFGDAVSSSEYDDMNMNFSGVSPASPSANRAVSSFLSEENENKIINDAIAVAISTSNATNDHSKRRKTILSRLKRSDESDPEFPPSRRERQMSFTLPERSLLQQSQVQTQAHAQAHAQAQVQARTKSYYDMVSNIQKVAFGSLGLSSDEERQKMAKIASAASKAAKAAKERAISIGGDVAAAIISNNDNSDDSSNSQKSNKSKDVSSDNSDSHSEAATIRSHDEIHDF